MSVDAKARKDGAAATPVAGPANTLAAACVCQAAVSVPLFVTGDPETVNSPEGSASATEVTDPTPPPPVPIESTTH